MFKKPRGFLRLFLHFPFAIEKEIPASLENLSENIYIGNKPPKRSSMVSPSDSQAKWMKFFTQTEPAKIDLERSIKSENLELITNYVRLNYFSFDFTQLVLALEKNLRADLNQKLFNEIKLRIAIEEPMVKPEILLSFLKYSPSVCRNDPLVSRFLCLEMMKAFPQFKFKEKVQIISFLFSMNCLDEACVNEFLDSFQQWKKNEGIFNDFDLKSLNELLSSLNTLYHLMKPDIFSDCFTEVFINLLFQEVIQRLNQAFPVELQEENQGFKPEVLSDLLQPRCSDFFNAKQKNIYKQIAGQIIYEKLNEEGNFGRYITSKEEKLQCIQYLMNLFDPSDRYLLNSILPLVCQVVLKDQGLRKDWTIFPIFARFNVICQFFFNETVAILHSLPALSKLTEFQMFVLLRTLYECNFEEVLFAGFVSNEYLRSSWEHIVTKLYETLEKTLNKGENFRFKQNLKDLLALVYPQQRAIFLANSRKVKENSKIVESEDDNEAFMYREKITNKTRELEANLEQTPKIWLFDYKFQQKELIPLKIYLFVLEITTKLLCLRVKGSDKPVQALLESLKTLLSKKETCQILENMPFIPSFLENLLFLQAECSILTGKELLEEDMKSKLMRIKREIDEFFNKTSREPANILRTIEKNLEEQVFFDGDWEEHAMFSFRDHEIYLNSQAERPKDRDSLIDEINFQRTPDLEKEAIKLRNMWILDKKGVFRTNSEDDQEVIDESFMNLEEVTVKNRREEDFLLEKYALTPQNLCKKVLYSKILYFLLKESVLKGFLEVILKENSMISLRFIKNYVDYPFFCDFLVEYENETFAFIVKDHEKLVLGVEDVLLPYFKQAQRHFENQGIRVIFVDYSFYHAVKENSMLNLRKIFMEAKGKNA